MSKALKLSVSNNNEITHNKNSDWIRCSKESKCQPDMFRFFNMCYPQDQILTIFRSYIDKDMLETSDLSKPLPTDDCHILMVFNNAGFEILHIEKTCPADKSSVQTALHAMLCEIGDMIDLVL